MIRGRISWLGFLLFAVFAGCASQNSQDAEPALQAAEAWLANLDASNEELLWAETSILTQEKEDKTLLLKQWTGIRKNFGKLYERDLQFNFFVAPYQFKGNIPDGNYRHIMYWSKYEKRELVKEEIIVSFENNQWKILQYVVR